MKMLLAVLVAGVALSACGGGSSNASAATVKDMADLQARLSSSSAGCTGLATKTPHAPAAEQAICMSDKESATLSLFRDSAAKSDWLNQANGAGCIFNKTIGRLHMYLIVGANWIVEPDTATGADNIHTSLGIGNRQNIDC